MQIALIGAGPRNLILTERLVTFANQSNKPVTITLFDPFPVGGRVWTPDQNPAFIANTIASHATLFPDDSIATPYVGLQGPNWFEWLKNDAASFIKTQNYAHETAFLNTVEHITPNTYPSRALFGVYSAWTYEQILKYAHDNVTIEHRTQNVIQMTNHDDQFTLSMDDGSTFIADQVILTPGHLPNMASTDEESFAHSNLTYIPVGHPGEIDLTVLKPKENVIVRGLGLSFFDYMAALTIGTGGTFTRQADDSLVYQPSGNEPHLIVGSRRGLLAHPRGENQKPAHVSFKPRIFTPERLTNDFPIAFSKFFELIKAEMQLAYYENLLLENPKIYSADIETFITALIHSDNLEETVEKFNFPTEYRYDWTRVYPHTVTFDIEKMQSLLSIDISDARLGNARGPYSNSYEVVKDMRALIREYLSNGIFDGSGYEAFLNDFGPFNNTVAVGPPLSRIEQLQALISAGIVTLSAPSLHVTIQDDAYVATDSAGNEWQAHALLEARLPTPNLAKTIDPLLTQLRQDGVLIPFTLTREDGSTYDIQATNMNLRTLQVQNHGGQIDNFFVWGVPTEGKRWFTTFLPRPNDHDSNMVDAETIAQIIFEQKEISK